MAFYGGIILNFIRGKLLKYIDDLIFNIEQD